MSARPTPSPRADGSTYTRFTSPVAGGAVGQCSGAIAPHATAAPSSSTTSRYVAPSATGLGAVSSVPS